MVFVDILRINHIYTDILTNIFLSAVPPEKNTRISNYGKGNIYNFTNLYSYIDCVIYYYPNIE